MDVDAFLGQPLVARVAVNSPAGPTVRPVWFLFDDGVLWWLTGIYSRVSEWLRQDARAQIVIDTCDLDTGVVLAVTLTGRAEPRPMDAAIATRKLTKYLGADRDRWPQRFRAVLHAPSTNWLIALTPDTAPRLRDLSFPVPG